MAKVEKQKVMVSEVMEMEGIQSTGRRLGAPG